MSNIFHVNQAILPDESQSVSKNTSPVKNAISVTQDQTNMEFAESAVTVGDGRAVVVPTGNTTRV